MRALTFRRRWILLAGVVLSAVGGISLLVAGGRGGSGKADRIRAATTRASTRPGAAASSKAAATTTSAPASQPVKKWSPPRFKARRVDRKAMVRTILRLYRLTDKAILNAMTAVPRHEFVPDRRARHAYVDTPLPIGYGQTISQPYIVAEMTRQLKLTPKSRVLEIGTGSGYQAAVLTEFTRHVYTIEVIKPLADAAAKRLKRLGYTPIHTRHADGYYGWPDKGPFDAIIVTCAAGQVPPPLIRQLAPGGRMVIPVGGSYSMQSLMLIEKDEAGKIRSRSLMGVTFVPFVRKDTSAK